MPPRPQAEAEKLLLAGYEGLSRKAKALPPSERPRLAETARWLAQLYEATDRADEAARWRAKRKQHLAEK
jgi:hypothetical protein